MQVQVNSDHNIESSAGLQNWVASVVEDRLDRFDELLTRVEVHLNDENAGKSGAQDKRCQMEARIKGHQPLSVTHKADSLDLAVDGAADKLLRAITHLSGKLEKKRLSGGELNDPLALEDSEEFQDSLRQDEFLEREQLAHDHELK